MKVAKRDLDALRGAVAEIATIDKRRAVLVVRRDRLIRKLAKAGMSTRPIAALVGLTHQAVALIITKPTETPS